MDGPRASTLAQIGGSLITLGAFLTFIGALTTSSTSEAGKSRWEVIAGNPWYATAGALGVIGAVLLIWSLVAVIRSSRRRPRFVEQSEAGRDGTYCFTLGRDDGQDFGYAVPRVYRRKLIRNVDLGEPETLKRTSRQGQAVTYCYPDHFPNAPRPQQSGKYKVVWTIAQHADPQMRRSRQAKSRVAATKFTVSDEDQVAAEALARRGTYAVSHGPQDVGVQLRLARYEQPVGHVRAAVCRIEEDGSRGPEYSGFIDDQGAEAVSLTFPADFRRETAETRRLGPGGVAEVAKEYDYARAEPGTYSVTWKSIAWATGGAFSIDHEITPEDFLRETDLAEDSFVLP